MHTVMKRWANVRVRSSIYSSHTQWHAALRFLHRSNCLHNQLVIAAHLKVDAPDDVREDSDRLDHGKAPAHAVSCAAAERNERIAVVPALVFGCKEPFGPKRVRVFEVVRGAVNPPNWQIKCLQKRE